MKKLLYLFAALPIISCSQAQKTEFTASALKQSLVSIDGKEIPFAQILSENRGKTVLIEVWASWCGDCVKAMPKIKALQNDHPEVSYVFISMDKAEDKWKSGIEKHELEGIHYWAPDGMKGKFGKSIDLDWIPRYLVIAPNGKIAIYRAIETDFDEINKTLNQLEK